MVGDDLTANVRLIKGNIRLIIEGNKYYVVGVGMLLPVNSYQEGVDLINKIEEKWKEGKAYGKNQEARQVVSD